MQMPTRIRSVSIQLSERYELAHREDHHLTASQLRAIVKAIRVSPQRRQAWATEVKFVRALSPSEELQNARILMLILDVKTRWSSTHQMLRKLHVISHTCLSLNSAL